MPKNYHTATAPCGTVLKRTSDSRLYTHCVAVLPSFDNHLKQAQNSDWHNDRANFLYHREQITGHRPLSTYIKDPETFKKNIHELDNLGFTDVEKFIAAKIDQRLTKLQEKRAAGYFDTYLSDGWAGRQDLADRRVQEARKNNWYADVVALVATVVTK